MDLCVVSGGWWICVLSVVADGFVCCQWWLMDLCVVSGG